MRLGRVAGLSIVVLGFALARLGSAETGGTKPAAKRSCPSEMARRGSFCIDRYEVSLVDKATGKALSPYYPAERKLLEFVYDYWVAERYQVGSTEARALPLPEVPEVQRGSFEPVARSRAGVLPNGYLTYASAKLACENAGKRLCTEDEWVSACRGSKDTKHPYGATFEPGKCNVFRALHPAEVLHGNASLGHLDPRLHLVAEDGKKPLLELTGSRASCVSELGVSDRLFDMEGNLDEWIEDPNGTFVGGFYSRSTREGCAAKIDGHAPTYTDYSLGTRCCVDR